MLAVAANVARAGLSRWEASGDAELGNRVWLIYGILLDRHPKNQQFLRGRALLSPAMGDPIEAMRCWRVLLAGTEKMTGVEEAVGTAWEIKRTRQR